MFSKRTTTQKPSDEFLQAFKDCFPGIKSTSTGKPAPPPLAQDDSAIECKPLAKRAATMQNPGQYGDNGDHLESGLELGPDNDDWRFTPGMFDQNMFGFGGMSTSMHGQQTPLSGPFHHVWHNPAAGDLHTPGQQGQPGQPFPLPTPISMPTTVHPVQQTHFDMQTFQNNVYNPQAFHNYHAIEVPSQTFVPAMLMHQDSAIDANKQSPLAKSTTILQKEISEQRAAKRQRVDPTHNSIFRYQTTLHAPTAMLRRSTDIPITYLNKGQTYTLTVVDSSATAPVLPDTRYRTVVRISFEDEEQRQKPSNCWQLWKEGRGLAEAHVRGGKLHAVEYVEPDAATTPVTQPASSIEVEFMSFDSFAITWSPSDTTAQPECAVTMRFNFLSTDFSHSKGVKGIPVRLCAKTEMVQSGEGDVTPRPAEIAYCKVKLFRDHGAERKLSNDVAHVKKSIEKLKTLIAQEEAGTKETGKRKRNSAAGAKSDRPSKAAKRRTWSISSPNKSADEAEQDDEDEDLHTRLGSLEDMFTSPKLISILSLVGEEGDDPDVYPVSLPSEGGRRSASEFNPISRRDSQENVSTVSSMESPYLGSSSTLTSAQNALSRQTTVTGRSSDLLPQGPFAVPAPPLKMKRRSTISSSADSIDVVGVDPTYRAPASPRTRPIACFYVSTDDTASSELYRAIYLTQRTTQNFLDLIRTRCRLDISSIKRVVHINSAGLRILVDDEFIAQIPEAQDMRVVLKEYDATNLKKEDSMGINQGVSGTELRLLF